MNAGRLYAVLQLVKQDYEKNETLGRLQATIDALSTSIAAVSESNAVAFRDALTELYAALDQSPLNSATPSQVEILKEIGAVDKVGSGLRSEIENTLDSNTVTPAKGLAELQRIGQVLSNFGGLVEQIVNGFEELKIAYEDLEPGESEIGVLIPWPVVHTNLEGLQKSLHDYDRALKTFGELAENNPESPIIRSVGSSALQLFIQSTPAIALCIATAIERLCALYKQILEIKILRKKVREQSLPDSVSSTIEAHEQKVAESGIDKIVEDLVKEFGKQKPKERLNELRVALRSALRFLAEQIDAGVDLEVRAEPPRPKDVAENEGEPVKSEKTKRALEAARKTTLRIQKAGAAMRTLDRTGEPILALDIGEKGKKPPSSKA
jgi:tetratricopeptide (TPR) repeat protein